MSFSAAVLAEQLSILKDVAGKPSRYVIALSGGLDSTVLMHALGQLRASAADVVPLLAIHIDHGLQDESAEWSRHCASSAAAIGVEFLSIAVKVELDTGQGLEASAREARYAALRAVLEKDDWLLSAHHRDDQAETLLLNLIRGSGPAGIAGIGDIRRFGQGWLVRPLLNVPQASVRAYADGVGLDWIEDPSNADRRFDRNFLRHDVLPRLQSRWADISARLHRSAGHAGEAAELLVDLASIDLASLGARPTRLPIDRLLKLSAARQRNVIRHCLRELGLTTPSARHLERILNEVIPARPDAQPLLRWPGASVRRHRNGLYLLPEKLAESMESSPVSGHTAALGVGLGALHFDAVDGIGLSKSVVERGLHIRTRIGGEEFQPVGQRHTRKLKKLLQEEGVVPWMRDRLPLVYSGERLVAVGDLWLARDATSRPGIAVHWKGRPALH